MTNFSVISLENKTITIDSLDSAFNSSSFSNTIIPSSYENTIVQIKTNLNTVSIENVFAGFNASDLTSVSALGFYIVALCLFSFIYILVERARR